MIFHLRASPEKILVNHWYDSPRPFELEKYLATIDLNKIHGGIEKN